MKRMLYMMFAMVLALIFAGCPVAVDIPPDDTAADDSTPDDTEPEDPAVTTYAVTVSPTGAGAGESVTADVSEAAEGDTVTLTAALESGRQVALSASGVTISPSTISSDGGTATFPMLAQAVEVSATFSDIPDTTYGVAVNPSGAEAGESVSADVSEAAEGDTVTLTAALNSGRRVALSASGVNHQSVYDQYRRRHGDLSHAGGSGRCYSDL